MSGLCIFWNLLALASEPAGDVIEQRILTESPGGEHWFLNGGSFRGDHFSPLDQINDSNVGRMGLDWSVDLPAPDGIAATPIVVDGVIYLSTPGSTVYALDARNGNKLWSFDPANAFTPGNRWTSRVNRGVAVWGSHVLVTVADCRLIALDSKTGRETWSQLTCDPELGYSITDAPHVGGGKVFVGNAGSESHKKTRGYVSAYDVDTGHFLWRFHTVPSDKAEENTTAAMKKAAKTWSGEALEKFGGGGNNWHEMTYDPESGLLFFGTAGALPYVHQWRSPEGGDNLFTSSVLAVDANTGAYVWHYQTVPEDSWDYNATMNLVLADLVVKGQQKKTLMIAPKNGYFYVLDRMTGELLSADSYVKVNWATHIDMETGRPVLDPAGMFWNAPPETEVAVWPSMWGSHNTQPMAFHPGTGLAYIPAINVPSVVTWHGDGDYSDTLEVFDEVDGKPHVPGMLIAWDPVKQQEQWSVNHNIAINGGVLATAGNLVFQGDAEGAFSALDAGDGGLLWSAKTGSAISAAPVSYILDDVQRVLIPVGAGAGMQFAYPSFFAGENTSGETRLMSFSLAGKASMPDINYRVLDLPELPELSASNESIQIGRKLFSYLGCASCHGKGAVARVGGSVPDLRFSTQETYLQWNGIVISGARQANGMPGADISPEESEALRDYVLSRAYELAAQAIHPVKMTKAQIAGGIFEDYEPVVSTHGENTTHDVEVFRSSNELFDAGMYRSGKVRFEIDEPYGVNEYMHFLEGGVTLTSSDGTVTEIEAGDSVVIPREWTGVWETDGYMKIYVIYSPDAPIE